MKIVKLTAENFKRLVAVEIKPDGNTVVISGKNGAGKSSVLDSITAVLCGKKQMPKKPIRDGEDHAEVTLETEDYIIKRTFTDTGGGTLTVTNRDNMSAKSPQSMLDKIVGQIAFDPMSFIGMEARKQRETLLGLVGLDLSSFDKQIADCKQKRSDLNAQKKLVDADLSRAVVTPDLPDEEVDVAELSADLAKWQEHNQAIQSMKDFKGEKEKAVLTCDAGIQEADTNIANLQMQINAHNKRKGQIEQQKKDYEQEIDGVNVSIANTIPADLNEITQQIADANETNAKIRANKQAQELQDKVATLQETYAGHGKTMKQVEANKAKALGKADMPVAGISVDADGVTFGGIPLSQVNSAKQLEISVAVSMALNPKLRVIRMNGNDLDGDSLATISKMVDGEGFQVWIEKVSDDEKCGIYIEDGMVKQVN